MATVAVIPARGGSKGIPRKNMRLMHGKPLIAYAVENALDCEAIDDIVVSSDSDEILAFAAQYDGVIPVNRDSELAQDAVTLDPVIYDAVIQAETAKGGERYEAVVTMQPTSPLLTSETLGKALDSFWQSGADTVISVVNAPHLSWKGEGDKVVPAYDKRLNRQQLPPNYLETGAFLITKRECLTSASRIGDVVSVFEVPQIEATDVDTWQDWAVCEAVLDRRRIVFRVDGYSELGLGHVYRALTLAYELTEHEVVFVCDAAHPLGAEKLREANMTVVEVDGNKGLIEWLESYRPDIFVHDCLDTTVEFMRSIRPFVGRIVTFEDLGGGARFADAVVNAIYEDGPSGEHIYSGKDYIALRDEFLLSKPRVFSERVERVLVMFGGTDPLDLSWRVYEMARLYNKEAVRVEFDFILGAGYTGAVSCSLPEKGIEVARSIVRVSDHMRRADLAFSSQGRTTFELASMGVPSIVLAQNERELLHRFAQMDNGFINLGLGSEVSDEDILSTFEWLVGAVSIRREMHRLMLNNDLRSGVKRVKRIILGDAL